MKRQQREHARLPVLLKKSPCLLFYLCLLLYSTSAASASLSCGILVTRNTCITRRNSKLNLLPKTNHHPTLYQNRRRTDRYRNKKYPIGNNIQTHTNTHTHNIYTPTCTILQIPRGGSTSNTRTEDNTGTGTKKGNSSKTKGSKGKKGTKRKDYTTANATATNTTATNTRQTTSKINQNANIFRLLAPISADDKSVSSTNLQVKALLKRRTISWRTVARLILVILTVVYIQQCRNTIGIPHRQAIWKILYQEGYFSSNSMPSEFLPTDMESFLAQQIANAANDLIPPILMPLSKPFLGAVLSILSFLVFTILLPHWFLQIQVWFDYKHKHTTSIAQQSAINSFSAITPNANAALVAVVHTGKNTFLANLRCTNTQAKMIHGMPPYYIEYNQRRYYYDPDQGPTCWEGGPNLNVSVANIIQSARNTKPKTLYKTTHVGLLNTPSKLLQAQERWYTYNQQMKVQIPTLAQALWQRLQSPLVCIQMIGKTLAVLEEGREAFLSLGSTILQHYQNARASILASRTLQQDIAGLATEFAKQSVWIYRQGQWKKMVATDLLPGDAFLLSSSSSASSSSEEEKNTATTKMTANAHHAVTIPVDALLLDGVCVTMESVLTGEAVPQTKLPVDSTSPAWNQTLEMTGTHRNSVLFAGTSLLHCAPPPSRSRSIHHSTSKSNSQNDSSPPPGVLCLALRTGAYSSKGELLQVLSSSQAKTGSSTISNPQFDKDALKLIFIMSTAAFLSCGSLFLGPPTTGKKVSSFRRAIQCTRIATACIPSDLPLYISTVVQLCAKILRDESDVVCSQPGELLTAARIDTVVFDKTGTLTADTQSLSKIVDLEETTSKRNDSRTTKKKAKTMRSRKKGKNKDLSLDLEKELVLAGCHSLVFIKTTTDQHGAEGELVGDPLEIAALEYGQWKYDPQGQCFCPQRATDRPDGIERLWQLIVFPFDPALRLSSAICLTCHKDGQYRLWKVVKGSPDKVKELLERNADFEKSHTYQKKVQSLESKGFRTIAMAVKELTDNDGAFAKAILVATRAWTVDEADTIERARSIPRSDIDRDDLIYKEGTSSTTSTAKKQDDGGGASASAFDFAGFACYTAGIRPSSKRIINELKRAKIATVMLTGDSIAAAIAVAAKVGIMDDSSVAVLEALPGTTDLVWRILSNSAPKKKMTNPTILEVTKTSSQKVLEKARRGELRIAITGAAFQALQSTPATDTAKILLESIGLFSVIARATPQVKENFVSFLQNIANREVLMCG
mgnify:CR=1 FL=1